MRQGFLSFGNGWKRKTDSTKDKPKLEHPRLLKREENVKRVVWSVREDPKLSIEKSTRVLNLRRSSLHHLWHKYLKQQRKGKVGENLHWYKFKRNSEIKTLRSITRSEPFVIDKLSQTSTSRSLRSTKVH